MPPALVSKKGGRKEEENPVFTTFVLAHQAGGRLRGWADLTTHSYVPKLNSAMLKPRFIL